MSRDSVYVTGNSQDIDLINCSLIRFLVTNNFINLRFKGDIYRTIDTVGIRCLIEYEYELCLVCLFKDTCKL